MNLKMLTDMDWYDHLGKKGRRRLLLLLLIVWIILSIWAMGKERNAGFKDQPSKEDQRQLNEMRNYHTDNTIIFDHE